MPYAMFVDESGDFKEGETIGGGRSLVGGWIADNDEDHDGLRQVLNQWLARMEPHLRRKEYHATVWRRFPKGRELLSGVFGLAAEQAPYKVALVENRSASTSESADFTYLDMLVELIVDAIFDILEDRKEKEALPLQVYVAERKGVQNWEIDRLVRYRMRALMAGSVHKGKRLASRFVEINIRNLKKDGDKLNSPQSNNRKCGTALMPELILADFLCNSLYQLDNPSQKPPGLDAVRYDASIFIRDPFWKDLQVFKRQKRWVEIAIETASPAGLGWVQANASMKDDFETLQSEAFAKVLQSLPLVRQLLSAVDDIARNKRDFAHAKALIEKTRLLSRTAPDHLRRTLDWKLAEFALSVANHLGDNAHAQRQFESLGSFFESPDYHRTEFVRSIPDNFNRYAVSITDRYDFQKAEKILEEIIEVEKSFLQWDFQIQGRRFRPAKSDILGQIYSTLGQLRSKQARRDKTKAKEALALFDLAESHMGESLEPSRQRNYRIEAILESGEDGSADKVFDLLADGSHISAQALFHGMKPDVFDAMYWLRWMLIPENSRAEPYRTQLLENHAEAYLCLDGDLYPQTSVLYYFGRIALESGHEREAKTAWEKASLAGSHHRQAGVMRTLALRPLCALALAFPEQSSVREPTIREILDAIRDGDAIQPAYFERYFHATDDSPISRKILEELMHDIPYS